MKETGIYYILNKANGKCYVGSSATSIKRRWYNHKRLLNQKKHSNNHLQNAWNKDGEDNFEFVVLEIVPPDRCIEREQFYLSGIRPEYNIYKTAGSPLGRSMSVEQKLNLSVLNTGKTLSEETKKKISFSLLNLKRKNSKESIRKMLENRKKRVLTPEILQRMSEAHKLENLSPDTRKKMSEAAIIRGIKTRKMVKQINKNTDEIIKVWPSISEATRYFNRNRRCGSISSVCRGLRNNYTAFGFKWEYA